MASFQGLRPSDLSGFLHITLHDVKYSVSEQVLHQVFYSYGAMTVRLSTSMTAVVSFPTMSQATRAGREMQGRCIYDNCCWMQIQFAPEQVVASATRTAAQASRTPAPTPLAAPPTASFSEPSVGATAASVCVRASPASSPSSPSYLTAADEEKPVMASLVELQAELERILAKFTPMEENTTATSSLSTTSPATASVHPPPPTTITAAATTTTRSPTAPVPPTATPEEAPANIEQRLMKLSVVRELALTTPTMCSMKCRDVLHKQRGAKVAVLPATTHPTESVVVHNRSSHTERSGVPLTDVMVSSVRVPPWPPDWRCTTQEQGASLPPFVPLSTCRKEPRCLWLRPMPTRPPDQCKAGPLPVPSRPPEQPHGRVIADGQVSLASQPRYDLGGFREIFVERDSVMCSYLAMIAVCLQCAEIMQSNANSRGFLDTNHYKLNDMVLCWNVGLLIMPYPEADDVNGLELCWKLQAGTLCHRIQWIAKNHYRIMPCVGKNIYCKQYGTYLADLATTSIALVAVLRSSSCVVQFLMIWDPGITEGFMIVPYYPGNTIGVYPSECRSTVVQQFMNTERQCTTPSLVQLRNFISVSHQIAVEVGLTTSKYFCFLELSVKPKVEINGVTIIWVELHVYSTCVWVSFPWNPGLHTWLWCFYRMHERQAPNSINGCDLLEQSCCGNSRQVEAWTHTSTYIEYDVEVVNKIVEDMVLHSWIKFNGTSMIGGICLGFYNLQQYVHMARIMCLLHAYQFVNIDWKTWDPGAFTEHPLQHLSTLD